MKDISLTLALFDFIPVILFSVASFLIGMDLRKKTPVWNAVIYFCGFILVFCAGVFKALYKLLYAAGIGDFTWMSSQFFTNQALGFVMMGFALIFSLKGKKKDKGSTSRIYSFIPVFVLVGLDIIGLAGIYIALGRYALKLRKTAALVLLVISFILSLGMGYLSTRNFDSAAINWIAQTVNTLSQLTYLISCLILHKSGLHRQQD